MWTHVDSIATSSSCEGVFSGELLVKLYHAMNNSVDLASLRVQDFLADGGCQRWTLSRRILMCSIPTSTIYRVSFIVSTLVGPTKTIVDAGSSITSHGQLADVTSLFRSVWSVGLRHIPDRLRRTAV